MCQKVQGSEREQLTNEVNMNESNRKNWGRMMKK